METEITCAVPHHQQASQHSSCVGYLGEGWPQLLSQKKASVVAARLSAMLHEEIVQESS